MKPFALSNEPLDYQVSVHISNMFSIYPRFQVMSAYDFLKEAQFELIYEDMRPSNDTDRMSYALYNIIQYYGWSRMDAAFTELFGEKVESVKTIKPRKLKGSK